MVSVRDLKVAGIVSIRDELLRQQAEGIKVARTESGDPSFNMPSCVKKSIIKALMEDKTHYTAGAGIPELREAIFDKVTKENEIYACGPQDVVVTNGAMNALYVVFQSLSKFKVGEKVLVPTPTWTETVDNLILAGFEPVYYTLDPFKYPCIDMDEIASKMSPRVAAVVINTPHNPTGAVIDRDTMLLLTKSCRSYGAMLISDEAYEHVIFPPHQHISPGSLNSYDGIVSIFSCSKSYAMSGLRVGYIVNQNPAFMKQISKMVRCTINGVNSATQWGAVSAVKDTPAEYIRANQKVYLNRRDKLFAALHECSLVQPILPKGAFYIWAKLTEDEDGWATTMKLLDKGVGSAPGEVFGPGGKGHIRFSFSCADHYIDMASEILKTM